MTKQYHNRVLFKLRIIAILSIFLLKKKYTSSLAFHIKPNTSTSKSYRSTKIQQRSFTKLCGTATSTSSTSPTSINDGITFVTKWIQGRRCLFVPSRNERNRNKVSFFLQENDCDKNDDDNDDDDDCYNHSLLPPIVILGGMAQSIPSWQHHLPTLSKDRDILVYEYLGSGLGYRHPDLSNEDTMDKDDVTEVCFV